MRTHTHSFLTALFGILGVDFIAWGFTKQAGIEPIVCLLAERYITEDEEV